MLKALIGLFGIVFISGCVATASEVNTSPQAATITNPNEQTHDELQQAIASLLGASSVVISDNAFVQYSQEVIERKQHKDANGLLIMGRSTEIPDAIQLLKQGDACLLRHVQSTKTITLSQVHCKFEDAQ
ncbi:hypothetical protein K8B83_04595 [Shewanella inventionis]|uniref:Lipoprotein n=1 Tax=Shewanella inventionis TaxID=1738770 RepID=A0ABQ1JQH0_9GAMM|nr:hypothetical protein [Shewanella inventionis]MCL1159381.1 hypothetical protein [Shewanella inventionis]UAL44136.1 hypothetical protein K8B83_04595 [Shewanella inventionis]GGB72095.1 hypothetical protein GCM10011607_35730 [Shewanella inventionis]